jgi:hypothetical protein
MISAILAGDTELYYGLIRPYELSVYRIALTHEEQIGCGRRSKNALDRTVQVYVECPFYCNKQQSEHRERHLRRLGVLSFCRRRCHSPLRRWPCPKRSEAPHRIEIDH